MNPFICPNCGSLFRLSEKDFNALKKPNAAIIVSCCCDEYFGLKELLYLKSYIPKKGIDADTIYKLEVISPYIGNLLEIEGTVQSGNLKCASLMRIPANTQKFKDFNIIKALVIGKDKGDYEITEEDRSYYIMDTSSEDINIITRDGSHIRDSGIVPNSVNIFVYFVTENCLNDPPIIHKHPYLTYSYNKDECKQNSIIYDEFSKEHISGDKALFIKVDQKNQIISFLSGDINFNLMELESPINLALSRTLVIENSSFIDCVFFQKESLNFMVHFKNGGKTTFHLFNETVKF